MASSEDFQAASKHFETVYKSCSDSDKLKLYALWNQATSGDVTEPEPASTAFVKKAKWQARRKLVGMDKDSAAKRYVNEVKRVDPTWRPPSAAAGASSPPSVDVSAKASSGTLSNPTSPSEKAKSGGLFSMFSSGVAGAAKKSGLFKSEATIDEATFQRACTFIRESGNPKFRYDVMLYALFKQATVGPCNRPAPIFSIRKQYSKWQAWKSLLDMSQEEAKLQYVQRVKKLAPAFLIGNEEPPEGGAAPDANGSSAAAADRKSTKGSAGEDSSSPASIADKIKLAHDGGGYVYLVTGATGFVGKHLLERLLNRNPSSIILAVTRPASIPKLNELCSERFGFNGRRVIGIKGDITSPLLGLDAAMLKVLSSQAVDHYFHIAAVYDMRASDADNEKTNVGGTREAVKVANQIKAKLFHHTSSIAVCGDFDGLFLESMFDQGQKFDHAYLRTKFESEKIVRNEIKVPLRIYRPGIIIGSSKNGEADKIDGIVYLFKPIQQTRKWLPQSLVLPCIEGGTVSIVPIDFVADAMDFLAHKQGLTNGRCFHLVDPSAPSLVELMNVFAHAAHAPTYSARLPTIANALIPKAVWQAIAKIPIIEEAPFSIFSAFFAVPESVVGYSQWTAEFDTCDTTEALEGKVVCPPLESYAWRVWDYYERQLDLRNVNRPMALREEVRGKLVVVTGSSDGIGERLAQRLGKQGAKVILVSRSMDKLKLVGNHIRSNGGVAFEYVCDLAKGEDCVKVVNEITAKHGAIDILVNNAGRSIRRSVEYQCDPSRFHDFQRTMDLNYFGSVRMIVGFLPGMRKKKLGQIINVSSVGVVTNAPRFGAYVASKAALDGFTRCISSEIQGDNVTMHTIYMPLVKTKMVESKDNNYQERMNLLSTDEACELIERAIVTKERVVMTLVARVVFTMYNLFPTLIESLLHRQYKLEPEAAPTGVQPSASAQGDKTQLRALGALLSGGTLMQNSVTPEKN